MSTVYKYPIVVQDTGHLSAPQGAKPLSFQLQHEGMCLWMEVDPRNAESTYEYRIFGTGHHIPDDYSGEYVGTVLTSGNALVWHLYLRAL